MVPHTSNDCQALATACALRKWPPGPPEVTLGSPAKDEARKKVITQIIMAHPDTQRQLQYRIDMIQVVYASLCSLIRYLEPTNHARRDVHEYTSPGLGGPGFGEANIHITVGYFVKDARQRDGYRIIGKLTHVFP